MRQERKRRRDRVEGWFRGSGSLVSQSSVLMRDRLGGGAEGEGVGNDPHGLVGAVFGDGDGIQ